MLGGHADILGHRNSGFPWITITVQSSMIRHPIAQPLYCTRLYLLMVGEIGDTFMTEVGAGGMQSNLKLRAGRPFGTTANLETMFTIQ
jgi:hypothetical protein